MQVTVVGMGYVGLVAASCLAELGHHVICVDSDAGKVARLEAGEVPIHEAFLPELLAKHRGSRLTFHHSLAEGLRGSQIIFVAVGTPALDSGEADISAVEAVAVAMAPKLDSGFRLIVTKSTAPVYTCDYIRRVLRLNGVAEGTFEVACNPEFMREGSAITDFLFPDRIVLGCDSARAATMLRELYAPLLDGAYGRAAGSVASPAPGKVPELLVTTTRSAEIIKHASNAFLAMKISFINAVANICEAVGADIEEVRRGVGTDARIGRHFLQPGIGYGGSCFPKDLAAFSAVAKEHGYQFTLLDEVRAINAGQCRRFVQKLRAALWTFQSKRIGVLGLAFKNGTDDIRESPAMAVVEALLAEGAVVQAYDPAAMSRAAAVLPADKVTMVADPYAAADRADALLVLTEWDEFRSLDLQRVRERLRYPIIADGRNLLDPSAVRSAGFVYLSLGRRNEDSTQGLTTAALVQKA